VNNYNTSLTTLAKCKERYPIFDAFLSETMKSPECNKLDIYSYLIMPIQRLPRYQLLLADLVKNTLKSHPDYYNLVGALEKIKGVAEYINEEKRKAEQIEKILEIQESFSDKYVNLLQNDRILKQEGDFLNYTKSKNPDTLHFFFI